jgi:hypothetical protein
MRRVAAQAGPTFRRAATDVSTGVRDVARRTPARVRTFGSTVRGLPRSLPPGVWPELATSMRNLRKVRSPRDAVSAFETETERLLTAVMPLIVQHPLPVQSPTAAKAIVATAGGLAAVGEEWEEVAAVVTAGVAVAPTMPIVLAANLTALTIEVTVAASLRVHQMKAAGIEPEPEQVARDVIFAMTGKADDGKDGGIVSKAMVKSVVTRVASRWGLSLVPFAGIAYSGWDAKRTIDAIDDLPMPIVRRPRASLPIPLPPALPPSSPSP